MRPSPVFPPAPAPPVTTAGAPVTTTTPAYGATASVDLGPVLAKLSELDSKLGHAFTQAANRTEQVGQAVAALERRLAALEARGADDGAEGTGAFRQELFDWLEGYTQWEVGELEDLRSRLNTLYHLFVPGAVDEPPRPADPPTGRPRFSAG